MICPNFNIEEVFNGFNEIVKALGGKPMTEEEFKSSELRNKRTGRNYSAMEAAYKIYHRNNGNMLDFAPNGQSSILFQSLLQHFNGDRTKAIKAKSNVYSDRFFNWFGDWTSENKENTSKVVDENGEPLVVWHGTDAKFDKFDNSKNNKSYKGFFFTDSKTMSSTYGNTQMPVFLNIGDMYYILGDGKNWNQLYVSEKTVAKNIYDRIRIHRNNMKILLDSGKIDKQTYEYWDNKFYKNLDKYNNIGHGFLNSIKRIILDFKLKSFNNIQGDLYKSTRDLEKVLEYDLEDVNIIFKSIVDYGARYVKHNFEPNDVFVVTNPNNIKHVENLGTWNPADQNIYHYKPAESKQTSKLEEYLD